VLSLREAVSALYGAYRLARFDRGGMAYFDSTIEGFWKSFFAAVLVAPLYILLLGVRLQASEVPHPVVRYLAVELTAYVIAWVVFPLAMVTVARVIDREARYFAFIVAYNWAAVWQNLLHLSVAIAIMGGLLPQPAGDAIAYIVLVAVLIYSWFIARTALDVPAPLAAALVALDLVLGILINAFAEGLL